MSKCRYLHTRVKPSWTSMGDFERNMYRAHHVVLMKTIHVSFSAMWSWLKSVKSERYNIYGPTTVRFFLQKCKKKKGGKKCSWSSSLFNRASGHLQLAMTVIVFACVKIQLPSGMTNHTESSSNVWLSLSACVIWQWWHKVLLGRRVHEQLLLNGQCKNCRHYSGVMDGGR